MLLVKIGDGSLYPSESDDVFNTLDEIVRGYLNTETVVQVFEDTDDADAHFEDGRLTPNAIGFRMVGGKDNEQFRVTARMRYGENGEIELVVAGYKDGVNVLSLIGRVK